MTLTDPAVDPSWTDIATVGILAGQLLVLFAAAVFGLFQVREARRLRVQQVRPFVVIDFEAESFIVFVSITNLGRTLARDVRISITPELTSTFDRHGEKLASLRIFTEGIPSLPPGKKIRTVLDTAIERKPEKGFPDAYTAEVIYWDADNRERYEGTFNLDLGIYWGLTQIDRRDLHDIHKRLDEISKTLKSWSAGGRGLLTLSPNEQRQRSEEMIERHRERVAAREEEIKTEDEEASEDEDADADADADADESTN